MRDGSDTWNDVEAIKEQAIYDTEHKIAELIERKIRICREAQISNQFLMGLELAKLIVLRLDEPSNEDQQEINF
jgi:hypothetical protein